MKWWIAAGVLAFGSVCAFIGVTVWLGLNMKLDGNNKTVIRDNHSNREVSLISRTEEHPVVSGPAAQKDTANTQRLESNDTYTGKTENDEIKGPATTELFGGLDEEAFIEEVPKPQMSRDGAYGGTHRTALHQKVPLTSGSPLYPQPVPETPTFVPEDRIGDRTVTPVALDTSVADSQQSTSEQQSTPLVVVASTTATNTGETSVILEQLEGKPERNAQGLRDVKSDNPTGEMTPPSLEGDNAGAFTGQEDAYIRRFDIADAVNIKGEHFMPQHFEFPHDRDIMTSQQFGNQRTTESLVTEQHIHEVTEDGVHRDGIPSLDQDDGLFYVPSNPDRYDGEEPDLAENPFTTFLQGRLQELYNWLSTDEDLTGKYNSDTSDNSSLSGDFMKVLVALNRSLTEGNSSILLGQLKDMYYSDDKLNVTDPAVLHNSSNLVSFGLLAFDLLLLRNVQQIAWEEERVSNEEMMKDPEVLALNALFMPPEEVRQLQVGAHLIRPTFDLSIALTLSVEARYLSTSTFRRGSLGFDRPMRTHKFCGL